jgi:hypothetical protein
LLDPSYSLAPSPPGKKQETGDYAKLFTQAHR